MLLCGWGTTQEVFERVAARPSHGLDLLAKRSFCERTQINWNCPKQIPGGRTIQLADFSDILPTLCDLADVKLPGDLVIDGRSHAALLRGEPGAKPAREWIFNQYHTTRTIRDSRFKLYSTGQFFDLTKDELEQRDLAPSSDPEYVAARKRLAAVLQTLPPDTPPPFTLRSQSAFQLRSASN